MTEPPTHTVSNRHLLPQSTLDSHLATSHVVQSLTANTHPIIASPGTRLRVIAPKPEPSFFFSSLQTCQENSQHPHGLFENTQPRKKKGE